MPFSVAVTSVPFLQRIAAASGLVQEQVAVTEVMRSGDRVDGLGLSDGTSLNARYFVDASGGTGILRRAMDVTAHVPTRLRNIAIWSYWQNAEWATSIGVGGTRVGVSAA